MMKRSSLIARIVGAAALVPFGVALLAHAPSLSAPDRLASVLTGTHTRATEDNYGGGADNSGSFADAPSSLNEITSLG